MAPTARAAFEFPAFFATSLYVIDFPLGIFRTILKTFSRKVLIFPMYRPQSLVFRPRRIGLGPTSRTPLISSRPFRDRCNNRSLFRRPVIPRHRDTFLSGGLSFPPR